MPETRSIDQVENAVDYANEIADDPNHPERQGLNPQQKALLEKHMGDARGELAEKINQLPSANSPTQIEDKSVFSVRQKIAKFLKRT